jgi:hypothetical protein
MRPCFAFSASDLDTQTTGRPLTLPAGPQSTQALNEHRVCRQSGWSVYQGIQDLVVPSGGHVEQFANCLFLGSGVLPPLALEGENLAITTIQTVTGAASFA